jgi:hypothetical protein
MYISGGEVIIRRLHFKDGTATDYGGAIYKAYGALSLESCIFNGNRTTGTGAYGGAIYNQGTLSVSGCTFYGNTTGYRGGAIYNYSGTLTVAGNLFCSNTAVNSGNVVYNYNGTVNSGGYNASDMASGTGSTGSGWTFYNGDTQATMLPIISATSFRPLPVTGEAIRIVPAASPPEGFPATDFYGNTRTGHALGGKTVAGAVAEFQ